MGIGVEEDLEAYQETEGFTKISQTKVDLKNTIFPVKGSSTLKSTRDALQGL